MAKKSNVKVKINSEVKTLEDAIKRIKEIKAEKQKVVEDNSAKYAKVSEKIMAAKAKK